MEIDQVEEDASVMAWLEAERGIARLRPGSPIERALAAATSPTPSCRNRQRGNSLGTGRRGVSSWASYWTHGAR
jgi:hypothetical protein